MTTRSTPAGKPRSRKPAQAPIAASSTTPAAAATPTAADPTLGALLHELRRIADALETHVPQATKPDFADAPAYHWERVEAGGRHVGRLSPVQEPALIEFSDLRNVDQQREIIERNTRQFVQGRPANNVLLTGARGTGKSSLVKACLAAFHKQGLRIIEIDKEHLNDLPAVIELVRARPQKYIVFCDDLSFEEGETGYKGLKTALDGSVSGQAANMLIYATSNRRHLIPDKISDNLENNRSQDGELRPGDAVEEKISLSERFGIWLSFYSFSQDEYLEAVRLWLKKYGVPARRIRAAEKEALLWALSRGARSGRIAAQFAKDYVAQLG